MADEQMPHYELYRRGRHIFQRSPRNEVRVVKLTRITFTKSCTEWLVKRGKWLELLWDADAKLAAFRPLQAETSNSYLLHITHDGSQSYVSARSFINFIGAEDLIYPATLQDNSGLLEINLREPSDDSQRS